MNGKVNQMRDGRDLTSLYELFGQAGWRRGLVTTAEITHATPAGFAANVSHRDKAELIASQYLDRRIDILLGGGSKFFDPKERKDKRNLWADFGYSGYVLMRNLEDLQGADLDRRWLGVFDSSHLPFTLDHQRDAKKLRTVPTLATMTARSLEWLERRGSPFILQVEGGRVDHGAHNSDAAATLYDQIAFDEAIDVCMRFQKQAPDTLLLITTDHGNSNLGLNGTGDEYSKSPALLRNLLQVKRSFPEILNLLCKTEKAKPAQIADKEGKARAMNPHAYPELASANEGTDAAKKTEEKKDKDVIFVKPAKEIIDIVFESTGYKMTEARARLLAPFLSKKASALYDGMNSETAALGQVMANYLGIGFTGSAHTSDYVPILTLGPGSEQFQGFIQNTEVFYKYLAFGKLDFRNPREPELAEVGPSAAQVENTAEYALA
jgi:alkaline phosphatase